MTAIGLVCLSLSLAQVGPERPRFSSTVHSVYLDVTVTGPNQVFLPELGVDDFEVLEDGVRQEISFFASDETAPVSLVLLLDASTSIAGSERAIRRAAGDLVREMGLSDQAAVVVFSDEILTSTHFTSLHDPLLDAVGSLYPRGSTALNDAIAHALDKLSRVEGRRALLVFTDGSDSRPMEGGSKASGADILELARRSEATVYTVGFIAEGRGVNRKFLTALADETGGRAFFPVNAEHLSRSFKAVEQELHTRYRIAFTPRNGVLDGGWRRVEVRIPAQPALVVRTRQGYYAEAARDP